MDALILAILNRKHRTKLLTKEELVLQWLYSGFFRAELWMMNDVVMSSMMARQIGYSTNDGQDSLINR